MTISEWLPNPAGKDTNEWVELFNGGQAAVNLSGWKLRTSSGKTAALNGNIQPGEYKVFDKAALGLTLKNTDEKLTLLSPAGKIADESAFLGAAQEAKSVNHKEGISYFAEPTPGAANQVFKTEIQSAPFVYGEPLGQASRLWPFLGMMLGTALTLAAAVVYILKSNETTKELFFGKY